MKEIWTSELSAHNKHIAYNAFAVSALKSKFGILDWTIQEIEHIDTQNRKMLCMTGNFQRSSDVDRLYLQRKCDGRGLNSIRIANQSRVIFIRQHLRTIKNKNLSLKYAVKRDELKLTRAGNEYLQSVHIDDDSQLTPRRIIRMYTQLK